MILFLKIALRNLFRQKRRSLLTVLTMAMGFSLLSLSIGLVEGSYGGIIKMFTESHTGHIQIHRGDYLERPSLYKRLESQELRKLSNLTFVKACAPRVYGAALSYAKGKTLPVSLMGIDPIQEAMTTRFFEKITEGTLQSGAVVVTANLAKVMDLSIGDSITLISQAADGSIANDKFPVTGILKGFEQEGEGPMLCYLSIGTLQEFLVLDDAVHEIAIMTDSYKKSVYYANKIRKNYDDTTLDVQPWEVVEKDFYEAMVADIKGMWISLGLVLFIVGIGVLNAVLMTVLERTREYGLLKVLGTGPFQLMMLILLEILIAGFLSCFLGAILSFFMHYPLSTIGFALPEPIAYGGILFTRYYSVNSFEVYVIPSSLIMITGFVVSLFPSIGIARKSAVEALGHV